MPEVQMTTEFNLRLTVPELRLVLKALDGRLAAADTPKAKELFDTISRQRATVTDNALKSNAKLLENLDREDAGQQMTPEQQEAARLMARR